jgi:hypothetical protein
MSTPKNLEELNRAIRRDNAKLVLKWVIGLAALGIVYSGYEAVTSPTSWADCVLSDIHGVQNDVAAAAVAQNCTQRFGSYENRIPLPWYRFTQGHYRDGNDCVIHEASNVSDAPRFVGGETVPGITVSLIATACHSLYDPPGYVQQ